MRLMSVMFALLVLSCAHDLRGQSEGAELPGSRHRERVAQALRDIASEGRVSGIIWSGAGDSVKFTRQGMPYVLYFADMSVQPAETNVELKKEIPPRSNREKPSHSRRRAANKPARAEQGTTVDSPDGKWIACYRDFNVTLEKVTDEGDGSDDPPPDNESVPENSSENAGDELQMESTETERTNAEGDQRIIPETVEVTSAGSHDFRYGTACWVYGEELFQSSAMWWSPNSNLLAFYEIDERHMRDYYLTTHNTQLHTEVDAQRYPVAGADNPYVGLMVYDLETGLTARIDVGGDRLQYVYNVSFSPDGTELLFSRTNRRQDLLEVMAADPRTGATRLVVAEQQSTWQENRPLMRFLADGKRFIWETERTSWKQYELRHLDGRRLNALSQSDGYPVESIERVDEQANLLYYRAYSGDCPNNAQLHRVRLDGTEHVQLTPKSLNFTKFDIASDNKWFVACREGVDVPPVTALFNDRGEEVAILAEPDLQKAAEAGLSPGELFCFQADDGATALYGILHKPAHFDPQRKYPLVVNVYGGPSSRGIWNRFAPGDPDCEYGCLIATIANRGTTGRGKAFETATYLGLGGVDLQDQVDGVKYLSQRPYVDTQRVGIWGHSYGGYMTTLALVKFPDVFQVGVAGAPVTDWKNYDTIYTERYMRTPQENPDGYRNGSCLTYAKHLRGKLLVMHGLIDDNVHPSNTWQLVDLLLNENVRFDMLIYPNSKHGLGATSQAIRWEFLAEHLKLEPLAPPVE